jgi:hypothetical protein
VDVRPNWKELKAVQDWRRAASRREVMLLWRIDYFGKVLSTLGTISASDERSAIDKAAAVFHITPAIRSKLVVTKIVVARKDQTKAPTTSKAGAEFT